MKKVPNFSGFLTIYLWFYEIFRNICCQTCIVDSISLHRKRPLMEPGSPIVTVSMQNMDVD